MVVATEINVSTRRRRWTRWTVFALWFGLATAPATGNDGQIHHSQAAPVQGPEYHRDVARYEIPNVMLADMHGRKISVGSELEAEQRPIILQFMFTTCAGVCPLLSSTLAQTQEELGDNLDQVAMWSITIDPEVDTPEQLQLYAAALGAQRQWRFFTGPLKHVVALQKAFNAYAGNKMRHQPLTFLRSEQGNQWVRLDGIMSASDLAEEYRRLAQP